MQKLKTVIALLALGVAGYLIYKYYYGEHEKTNEASITKITIS